MNQVMASLIKDFLDDDKDISDKACVALIELVEKDPSTLKEFRVYLNKITDIYNRLNS